MTLEKLVVLAGSGVYPRQIVENAKAAGVKRVEVVAFRGSTDRATVRAADAAKWFSIGEIAAALRFAAAGGHDGAVFAGQISPLSLFRARFDAETKAWLRELPVKCAHTLFQKVIAVLEGMGLKCLPASLFMDGSLPGAGTLTSRGLTEAERADVMRALAVVRDMGVHDVGQTVMVKSGMVLAVEAFEGTNAAIRRGGRLGGKGGVVVKAAREGHDSRFDIPVVGLKTVKVMARAGATALAFEAGRLILLEREKVIRFADRKGMAIVGLETTLAPFPTRI